jgi:hypothetical protein
MVIGWYPPGGYLSRFSTSSMGIYSPVSPVAVKEPKRASVQCAVLLQWKIDFARYNSDRPPNTPANTFNFGQIGKPCRGIHSILLYKRLYAERIV